MTTDINPEADWSGVTHSPLEPIVSRAMYDSAIEARDSYRKRWLETVEELERANAALDAERRRA